MPPENFFRYVETVVILNSHAPGILKGLYNFHKCLDTTLSGQDLQPLVDGVPIPNKIRERPKLLTTDQLQPVVKNLIKKFHESGLDGAGALKGPGLDLFLNNAKSYLEDSKKFYDVISLVVEFVETGQSALLQITSLVGLGYDITPDLTIAILDLFVNWFLIIDVVAKLPQEKKAILSGYAICHNIVFGHSEPRFPRIAKLLAVYDKHIVTIQEQLAPIGQRILQLISFVQRDVDTRLLMGASALKLSKLLVVMPDISGGINVESNDTTLKTFLNLEQRYTYLVVSFICFPLEFTKSHTLMDTLTKALCYGYLVPVYGDIVLPISESFDAALKPYQKMGDTRKMLKEVFNRNLDFAPVFHKQRRSFFSGLLRQLLAYCNDPLTFGPRLLVILVSLASARSEVTWYFNHFDRGLDGGPSSKDKRWSCDGSVFELMSGISALEKKVREKKETIRQATLEFLYPQIPAILDFFNNLKAGNSTEAINHVITGIQHALVSVQSGTVSDEEAVGLRLDWLRLQFCFVNNQFPQMISASSTAFIEKIAVICDRTRWMDGTFHASVSSVSTLSSLFYYLPTYHLHVIDFAKTDPDHLKFLGTYGDVVEQFMTLNSEYLPDEFKFIAVQSVLYTEAFYSSLARLAVNKCHEYATGLATLAPLSVQGPKTLKAPTRMRELATLKSATKNIIYALSYREEVTIYDSKFHPMEFFIEILKQRIQAHISSSAFDNAGISNPDDRLSADDLQLLEIKKPSSFASEMKLYLFGLQSVSEWGSLDFVSLFEEVLLDQSNPSNAKSFAQDMGTAFSYRRPASPRSRSKQQKRTINLRQPFSVTYALWFIDAINAKVLNGHMFYSHSEKRFLSRPSSIVQASKWLEHSEISALCDLMGPNGIVFIDMKLTEMVCTLVQGLKKIAATNMSQLKTLKSNWTTDGWKQINLISGLKDFTNKMIVLGFIFHLRKHLFDTLSLVYKSKAPHIYAFVKNLHERYAPNISEAAEYRSYDFLANSIGFLNRVDTSMQESLKSIYGNAALDQTIWSMIPSIFAAATMTICYDQFSIYNMQYDALENNGHCLAAAFNLITTNALPTGMQVSDIKSNHRDFINITSTLWWKLQDKKAVGEEMVSGEAAWVVIKHVRTLEVWSSYPLLMRLQFSELTNHLAASDFEEILPAALRTTIMSNIYHANVLRIMTAIAKNKKTETGEKGSTQNINNFDTNS